MPGAAAAQGNPPFQVVILAGGENKKLFPLTSGGVKALLPVGNRPLISYTLRLIEQAGISQAVVAVAGDVASSKLAAWLNQNSKVQCDVVTVPEEACTAAALRSLEGKINADTFVVLSGDLVSEMPLKPIVAAHQLNRSLCTVLLSQRRSSPSAETKPGKAPKAVDYIGLDAKKERLLFHTSSPDTVRDLKVSMGLIRKFGAISITSDLVDVHFYVFSKSIFPILASKPQLTNLKLDVLPFLASNQLRLAAQAQAQAAAATAGTDDDQEDKDGSSRQQLDQRELPGLSYLTLSCSNRAGSGSAGTRLSAASSIQQCSSTAAAGVGVYIVNDKYCARMNSIQSYGDINRDVAASDLALKLLDLSATKYDNVVAASTSVGNKSTIGNACIVGEHCSIGDKCSVKRSVIGAGCRLGSSAKVINSVLMDGVVVGDNCHVQNCILCAGAQLQASVSLKDCQVGPGFVVAEASDRKSEVLAKSRA